MCQQITSLRVLLCEMWLSRHQPLKDRALSPKCLFQMNTAFSASSVSYYLQNEMFKVQLTLNRHRAPQSWHLRRLEAVPSFHLPQHRLMFKILAIKPTYMGGGCLVFPKAEQEKANIYVTFITYTQDHIWRYFEWFNINYYTGASTFIANTIPWDKFYSSACLVDMVLRSLYWFI